MTPQEQAVYDKRWWTLGVLCISLMVVGLDNTILNVAIPTFQKTLGATASQTQWIVDSYVLVFAGLLLTMGALGDKFGRKLALTVGLLIFGASSLLSALSGSANTLVGTRALMGIGGALIMPSTLSILTNVFPPNERGRAIAIWAGISGMSIGIGPIAGGLLLEHFWWGSVFLVNVPVVVVAIVAGRFLVPESKDDHAPRLDPVGALLSIAGLASLVYAIIEAPRVGWGSSRTLLFGAAGVLVLGLFMWIEARSDHPMLPLEFFKNPRFSVGSAAITLAFFALFGSTFFLTQYQQSVRGYSPLGAGVRILPVAIALVFSASRSAKRVARFGTKRVVAFGMLLVAIGFGSLYFFTPDTPYVWLAALYVTVGFGMGCVVAPSTESIMGSLPRNRAGIGSAVNDTTRQVGGALGVAVFGSLLSSGYAAHLSDKVAGLPADVRGLASDRLEGALAVASRLKDAGLARAARVAFTDAMGTTALIAAGFALVGMVVVLLYLPARAVESDGLPAYEEAVVEPEAVRA